MPQSMRDTALANPLNSFAPRMAKAAIHCKTPEPSASKPLTSDAVSLLLDTLDALGIAPKEACALMGMDRSKFTRITQRVAAPTLDEIFSLPDHVWLELQKRMNAAKGLSEDTAREVKFARLLELLKLIAEVA